MHYVMFNRPKYNNRKTGYHGTSYDSKKEATKAFELDCLLKAKKIKGWSKQVKEELFGENGTKVCSYYCDFVIEHNDGTIEYVEIKSPVTVTPIFRLKWKLLLDKYKDRHDLKFTIEM